MQARGREWDNSQPLPRLSHFPPPTLPNAHWRLQQVAPTPAFKSAQKFPSPDRWAEKDSQVLDNAGMPRNTLTRVKTSYNWMTGFRSDGSRCPLEAAHQLSQWSMGSNVVTWIYLVLSWLLIPGTFLLVSHPLSALQTLISSDPMTLTQLNQPTFWCRYFNDSILVGSVFSTIAFLACPLFFCF